MTFRANWGAVAEVFSDSKYSPERRHFVAHPPDLQRIHIPPHPISQTQIRIHTITQRITHRDSWEMAKSTHFELI